MRFLIYLAFIAIVVTLLRAPDSIQMAFSQSDIIMEDVDPSTNNTQDDNANSGTQQIELKAQLKPDENEFLADEGWYDIKKFGLVASNGSEICPIGNCKYGVENGQFRTNTFTNGYVFEGKLKVTTEEGDSKKSKFYDFSVDLDKTGEEEIGGETTQTLEGTFGLGGDSFNPDIEYEITNSTLLVDEKNPVLTIQGERSPF